MKKKKTLLTLPHHSQHRRARSNAQPVPSYCSCSVRGHCNKKRLSRWYSCSNNGVFTLIMVVFSDTAYCHIVSFIYQSVEWSSGRHRLSGTVHSVTSWIWGFSVLTWKDIAVHCMSVLWSTCSTTAVSLQLLRLATDHKETHQTGLNLLWCHTICRT